MRKKGNYTKHQEEMMRNLIINYELRHRTPANQILKKLKAKGLGMKRKQFLAKIRVKRAGGSVKRFDTSKNVPIKYRKKKIVYVPQYLAPTKIEEKEENIMFRISLAINDVPVHKKYVSFLLQAYSLNKEFLVNKQEELKKKLLNLTNSYLGYSNYNALAEWNNFSYYIAIEYPTEILINRTMLGLWFFTVERNGSDTYAKSGSLSAI